MPRIASLFFVFLASVCHTQAAEVLAKLDDAKSRYDTAVEKLRDAVIKHLDSAEAKARKKGDTEGLQTIVRERMDFTDSNILPPSTPNDLIRRNRPHCYSDG